MADLLISKNNSSIKGTLQLTGSKSISNRVLILNAYGSGTCQFENLSKSKDTQVLIEALKSQHEIIDVGHAGTSFRFLCSYLCFRDRPTILTGSKRMKERPVGQLVDALNQMGAKIEYLEKSGYPPLRIHPIHSSDLKNTVSIQANTSSQFISSIIMMAPLIPGGLKVHLQSKPVSLPYLQLTIDLMRSFGAEIHFENQIIEVKEGRYHKDHFVIESDWSSASYLLILTAMAEEATLYLEKFQQNSFQGDSSIIDWLTAFGVDVIYRDHTLIIQKRKTNGVKFFEKDFSDQPDMFQGFSVLCAFYGIPGLFWGLETLKIKETDRIQAMQNELQKFKVFLSKAPQKFSSKKGVQYYMQEGEAKWAEAIQVDTYNDHRMALAFATLAMKGPIIIKDSNVVEKSYPNFWDHLRKLGFELSSI